MKHIEVDENGRRRVRTINAEPSKTSQEYKKECDANYILDKYRKTGVISHLAKTQGSYADTCNMPDLHESLIQIDQAQQQFYKLPAYIRKKFNNSMAQLIQFTQDPKNDSECVALGLKSWVIKPDKPAEQPSHAPKEGTTNDTKTTNNNTSSDS